MNGIMPLSDVIVMKLRTYNGRLQYRRWNETQGYRVDPYLIDRYKSIRIKWGRCGCLS